VVPLKLKNLSKRFVTGRGTIVAVDDVTLMIEAGELFFLLGPSGCGKTTLLRMVAGFVEPTAGSIVFGDRDVTRTPPERRDAAMVFQNYALWPHMTVAKNVGFGLSVRGMPSRQRRAVVSELLETVRIAEKAPAKPMELSGGQQQRVALARALAVRPQCLLLDEPLSNLDAALRSAMRWEIRRIVKAAGTTALYVTHDQTEALAIADRIGVMRAGRVVQIGTGQQLYEAPVSRFAAEFLGEANFLPGRVAEPTGRWTLLETPAGVLRARPREGLQPGQEVTCCIRPESLRLDVQDGPAAASTDENVFPARLKQWTHLGDTARFGVQLANGTELSGAAMPARAIAQAEQEVAVRLAAEDVSVLVE